MARDTTTISTHDLIKFLDNAIQSLENKGEIEAATRFEIFRDYVAEDVLANKKPLDFDGGRSLGL